ncbi:uncharacterized protein ARMOST_10050 [Armillaria ostoyae]|uniref:RNA-directed DNA polymerase n=1 Tax=Armillaria ostoyae TaxID=47428 RepID=A0A284RD83_ARMOS|nr:uncharacterized protein ARMOST_10050 [Armillaria ostoyae]
MQITIDFSTRTLIALVSTILGITSVLTIFLLYRTYKYEIGRFFRRLFSYAPRFPTPAYFSQTTTSDLTYYEHPGGAYFPDPPNNLNTPYVDPHDEFVYPTDGWNTGTGSWEPTSYDGSRTISHHHGNTESGSLPSTLPLSSFSHIPDVLATHPEHEPPHTIRAPHPQLPSSVTPDEAWALQYEGRPHTPPQTSSLFGQDPQARIETFPAPTHPVVPSPPLSPITLGLTPSPTPRSPAPPQPTIPTNPAPSPENPVMSPASSLWYEPGMPPMEIPEESHLPPPTLDLEGAIWGYLMHRLAVPPPVLRNATIDDLFHHFTRSLPEDPTWLLTTAGRDYMYFTNEKELGVEYILREEAAMHAAATWNRVRPWQERITVPPGYDPNPIPTLTPEVSLKHADVLEHPSRPPSHVGRPVRRHPMAGQYAGGADPAGDQGGHVSPPKADDPKLRSLPRGPGAPMPPNPPDPWDIDPTSTNPWNDLKPKIVREPAPFKGESVDSGEVFFQKFEELALEADIIDNEGQMAQMIEEAVRKTARDTIYAQPNPPPNTYEEWKRRILQIDYNWRLNKAAGGQQTNRPNNAGTSKGSSGATTSSAPKKTATGITYSGRGQPMDIDAINNGECFRCHQKGHISKNCPLQSWNKKKEEVRASTTEPSTGSKIEEVKDAAGNGRTYKPPVVKKCIPSMPHSILFAESRSPKPHMESHNRYATLATDIETVSIASSDEDGDDSTQRLNIKATQGDRKDSTAGASNGSPSTKDPALRNFGAKCHTSSPRGETQPTKVLDEKPPTIVVPIDTASQPRRMDGTWAKLKHAPCEVSSQDEQAALTKRSPIAMIDVEFQLDGAQENTARIPQDKNDVAGVTTFSSISPRGIVPIAPSDAPMPKVAGRTGNPAPAVRVQPIIPIATATELGDTLQAWQFPQPDQKEHDEDHQAHPLNTAGVAKATATKKIAEGQEVASAQVIERGHSVVMIEVPDEDDDTSFKLQQNKVAATDADACRPSLKRQSPLMEKEAEHPIGNDPLRSKDREAAKHAPSVGAPQEWLKPFETEWTWRAIKDAKNESAARSILLNWIHKTRAEEVVDNLLEGLRSSEHFCALDWLDELRKPKRYFIRAQNSPASLLLPIVLETLEQPISIRTKALIDSGCTGSSIHRDFVEKHGIPVQKTASSIPIYNADGSRNKAGEITAYAELRLKIGNHSERIDLAVTNLGSKEIFLGHDWLACHNPVINWTTGSVTFARCHCVKNKFVLPDADPDDEWELEEGETILSVDFEEAIEIRAIHKANELAAKANEGKEKKTFEQMVPESYRDFKDLFTKENFDDLPVRKLWDHAIELIPNAKNTLDCKVYPLNPVEQKELDKFLDENLASGHIKPSKSPMASPFFFVKKKDGTLHPVQDYRKLNEMTIKNRYPLPLISELMDKLGSAKYFTKLDVRWGYNNVCIKKDDEWKAAFRTNRGLFEPTVMFFGLTNSPATFQWMMNDIFKDLIATGKVTVYLDDILIFSKTLEEHRKITRRVLELLRKHKLFLKAEKCEFEVLETEYLGVIISENSIRMDPIKLAGIAEWPVPTKKKELQSFLGFANFYRRFIKGYSDIVCPMTRLTGKETWTWGTAQQMAFQRLKNQFTIDIILRIPTEKGQFRVEADASEGAIGAVLSQEQDGKWRPVAFLSKALTTTERNYEIYDKELLAIMLALDEWRHYLMGAAVDFEIWTDHQNLQYFRKPQKLNRRQARWVTELAEYHFTLHHKPGASNKKADLLSRRADHPQGQDDNDEITVLSPEHFRAMIMPTTDETHERIKSATHSHQKWDQGIANSLNHEKGIKEKDGLLYYDKRIYVPRDSNTRGEIISHYHDHITAGHLGIEKTKELVLHDYWWPKLKRDVEAYVQGCETCARTKASTQARRAPLHPNEIPSEPWTHISVDMITGLVPCKGFDAMLVIVDRFSKAIIPIACKTMLSSEGWAKILRDEVYAKYGMPVTVISNRGPQFVSKFLQDLYKMLDIKGNMSTAFHPQTDGQTERVNQEIEKYLRIFINFKQTDWPEWLPLAAFQHNNRIHSATGKSPFFINFGRNPRIAPDSHSHTTLRTPASEEFKTTMKLIHDETKVALEKAAAQMKNQYDKKKKAAIEYQTRDKVWLDTTNLHLARPKKKLNDKRVGPFLILEKRGPSAYKLKLPPTWKIYPVFNETLLTPYVAPTFNNQKHNPPPPPDIINDKEQYEIDTILDHKTHKVRGPNDPETGERTTGTATTYLISWKGYGKEENQWTKESELGYAKEAIAEYWKNRRDTITVQAIVVDNRADGNNTPTFILNSRIKNDDVQFQVQQGTDFVTTTWYFEHEIPHLNELIKDYYWASREEFEEEYGPVDGYAPEGI